jgi:hypothetical protein
MGLFGNKTKRVEGLVHDLIIIALDAFVRDSGRKILRQHFLEDELSDLQLENILFEQLALRLSIGLYWLDVAHRRKKITEEENNKINQDLQRETWDLAMTLAAGDQIKQDRFSHLIIERSHIYRMSYHEDNKEVFQGPESSIVFERSATQMLRYVLEEEPSPLFVFRMAMYIS